MYKTELSLAITSEFFKVRRTLLPWFVILGGIAVALLLGTVYGTNPARFTQLGSSLWPSYQQIAYMMISMVFVVPFIVLVTSMMAQIEYRSGMWKHLHSMEIARTNLYAGKLIAIVLVVASMLLICWTGMLISGYVLGWVQPVLEFHYFPSQAGRFLMNVGHLFIALLGVIAIQYWVTIRWQHYAVSIGVGLAGFIGSLVMFEQVGWARYFPYSFHLFLHDPSVRQWGALAEVEWYSLLCFALFGGLSLWYGSTREVRD